MTDPKEQFTDVSAKRLASIYAEALFNAAEQAQRVETVRQELDSLIDDVLSKDPRLEALMAGAAVGRKSRKEAIEKVFASRASDIIYKFLLVLNDHDRLDMIRPIRRALNELYDERRRRLRVYVYSAVPLAEDFQQRLLEAVKARFQLDPVLVPVVDPNLLGGLKLRIGDRVLDATVRTKIDNLRNQMIARSSHEIQSGRDRFSSAV